MVRIASRLHVPIDARVFFIAYQVPGVIVVVAYVTFIDHFETDSIADSIIEFVTNFDHIVPVSRGKFSSPLDIILYLRKLSIVTEVSGMLFARTLVIVLH